MSSPARFIVTILGKAGSGKTHLTRALIPYCTPPIVVIDTMDEFRQGMAFETAAQLRGWIVNGLPNATGIYVLKAQTDEDSALFFRLVARSRAGCTVVIDEASKFCSPNYIDEHLNASIQYGRHWGQNLIFNARRPAEINRNLTAQSDVLVSFRQTEPRDVAQLRSSFAAADRLPELEQDEFMCFGDLDRTPFGDPIANMRTRAGRPAFVSEPSAP